MTRYASHPVEQNFAEWDRRRKAERAAYWQALRQASNDYIKLTEGVTDCDTGVNGFYYYLQHNYGLKPEMTDGKYSEKYTVVNEKKFLLFKLQYWK